VRVRLQLLSLYGTKHCERNHRLASAATVRVEVFNTVVEGIRQLPRDHHARHRVTVACTR
jgi:hypothetical protein